jgi:hypothetical protein
MVPPRDGAAAIDVNAVVTRVKCDLRKIVLEKATKKFPGGAQPFLFLRSWAAKIRLSVVVDDSSAINPGASVTTPLHTVNNVAQSFTLGIGAGLTTQAVRQEDIEFLVSFSDIDKEFRQTSAGPYYYSCPNDHGILLESDLGLDKLIDNALMPVETGVLVPGRNVGPGVGPPPPIPPRDIGKIAAVKKGDTEEQRKRFSEASISELRGFTDKSNSIADRLIKKFDLGSSEFKSMSAEGLRKETTPSVTDLAKQLEAARAETARAILANSAEATELEKKTQSIVNNIVKPRYSIAAGSFDHSCLGPVAEQQFEALAQAANLSAFVVQADNTDDVNVSNKVLENARTAHEAVINATNQMARNMLDCAKKTDVINEARKKAGPPVYDPVSNITETVNFYITATGSVTPTWKLVRVTAPIAGTFISGTRKDTNTLILTVGRPQSGPNGIQASEAMNNQILYSILSQSGITVRP